ncbi:hypothetical protein [Parvibaculum sp.]|uniref:hypothetical protein n=1 Tax=Parvibaculum sp. TaxID=2024848 RepID=UPI00273049EF|nr:hypothetical protein [Parvibaculum sp.]MDP1628358.1 hypothetical protein [Parvibaculum sp.]MDP2149923.1 hypothetical protein [Parvibaculum sp.]MDP3329471.1 hypothetical protein [Parvibaculum sp.]
MEKKADCEKAIRSLCHEWAKETGFQISSGVQPHFSDFKTWLRSNGHARYLNFRSTIGASDNAEIWFDEELKQTWRN